MSKSYSPTWRLISVIVLRPLLTVLIRNKWSGRENIPANGSYSGFGFNGNWNGTTNAIPTNFALNGTVCTIN